MKKVAYFIISIIFFNFIIACTGYKPIYTTNLQFEITDYSLVSNKKLSKQIYSNYTTYLNLIKRVLIHEALLS